MAPLQLHARFVPLLVFFAVAPRNSFCFFQKIQCFRHRRSFSTTKLGLKESGDEGRIISATCGGEGSSPPTLPGLPFKLPQNRRSILSIPFTFGTIFLPELAAAEGSTVQCLSDLPTLPPDSIRVYLCRHGQTELNRLRRVQARANPPLNDFGEKQARLLGKALLEAKVQPDLFFHSPLMRAQQTAEIAASTFPFSPPVKVLPSLIEVDFGSSVEGQPVQPLRPAMIASYSAWALGDLDVKMMQSGENGREILLRVERAVSALVASAASCRSRCVAAVSHSAFLRIILATVLDISVYEALTVSLSNACICVVDFKVNRNRASPRKLTYVNPAAPALPLLKVPEGQVLLVNEKRHLDGLENQS